MSRGEERAYTQLALIVVSIILILLTAIPAQSQNLQPNLSLDHELQAAEDGFDWSTYYRVLGQHKALEAQRAQLEAKQMARQAFEAGGGFLDNLADMFKQSVGDCKAGDSSGGFWGNVAAKIGKGKSCREQQTTVRFNTCSMVSIAMSDPGIMRSCVQVAENDNQWIEFWKHGLTVGLQGVLGYYSAANVSNAIGLGRDAINAFAGTANTAITKEPFTQQTQIVEPQIVEPQIIEVPVIEADPDL